MIYIYRGKTKTKSASRVVFFGDAAAAARGPTQNSILSAFSPSQTNKILANLGFVWGFRAAL